MSATKLDGTLYRDEIFADLAERVAALPEGVFPLTLGGDHSVSMGTVTGNALRGKAGGARMGLIWVDAHTDYNTPESSPSGNIHGMPVAHLTGRGDERLTRLDGLVSGDWAIRPEDVVMIGIRSVDARERELLRDAAVAGLGIAQHSIWHIHEDLRAGRLEVVLPTHRLPDTGIHAVMPQRRLVPPRVRTFVDFMAKELGGVPPWERVPLAARRKRTPA